jgi:hypothetical protein
MGLVASQKGKQARITFKLLKVWVQGSGDDKGSVLF